MLADLHGFAPSEFASPTRRGELVGAEEPGRRLEAEEGLADVGRGRGLDRWSPARR